jgi:small subunit ribosomal protein S10
MQSLKHKKKAEDLILSIRLKAYHPYYINQFIVQTEEKLSKILGSSFAVKSHIFLPCKREHYTVLRSPHVDKKARDQFERVTHKRILVLTFTNKNMANVKGLFLHRIFRLLSGLAIGVELRVVYSSFNT